MKVSEAMEQVSMIKGNLEQVTAFLKTPELVRPTEPAELGERCYQFEDVHFAYNEAEILHGISFQTQPGTMTAIVGPSGSGKSTIAKLMAGFWDVPPVRSTLAGRIFAASHLDSSWVKSAM